MSSGSSGVMNVWFSRVKVSWMISSPSCSSCCMRTAARDRCELPSFTASANSREASTIRRAWSKNESKNFSWRGSSLIDLVTRARSLSSHLGKSQVNRLRHPHRSRIGNGCPRGHSACAPSSCRKRVSSSRPVSMLPIAANRFSFRYGYSLSRPANRSRSVRRTVPVRCEHPQGTSGAPSRGDEAARHTLGHENQRPDQPELFVARVCHGRQRAQLAGEQRVAQQRLAEIVRGVAESDDIGPQSAHYLIHGAPAVAAAQVATVLGLVLEQAQ